MPMFAVSRFLASGPKGSRVDVPLPAGGGFAVDRAAFDNWLCEKARQAGVEVRRPVLASGAQQTANVFRLTLREKDRDESVHARVLINATGRRNAVSLKPTIEPFFGCRTVYQNVNGLEKHVALHFVRQGHVGFNRIDDRRVAMCLYVRRDRLRAATGRLDAMMEQLAGENAAIGGHLRAAGRTAPWVSCLAQPDHREIFRRDGIYQVGDAVTMLNPVLGGGITAAMISAVLLTEELVNGTAQSLAQEVVARRYAARWQRLLAARVRLGRVLGWCENSVSIGEGILSVCGAFPGLLQNLVSFSRPTLQKKAVAA